MFDYNQTQSREKIEMEQYLKFQSLPHGVVSAALLLVFYYFFAVKKVEFGE
jgi:hypothetical protein